MKPQNLYLLTGILVILLILSTDSIWKPYLANLPFIQTSTQTQIFSNLDSVQSITLADENANQVTLQNQNQDWQVEGFPLDSQKFDSFIQALQSINLQDSSIVSTNPDKHPNYRLGEGEGIRITISWPDHKKTLILGDSGPQTGTIHIRTDDQPEVYLITSPIVSLTSTTTDSWRNKTILNITDPISSIDFDIQGDQFTLQVLEDDRWQITQGQESQPLDTVTARRLLQSFSPLEADTLADESQTNTFINTFPKSQINLYNPDGDILSILELVQNPNSESWLIKPDSSDTIYLLEDTSAASFLINPDDYL